MTNPIKLLRLMWHMRKVPGGYIEGSAEQVTDAFIKAGIFKENEREDAIETLKIQRVADAAQALADRLKKP